MGGSVGGTRGFGGSKGGGRGSGGELPCDSLFEETVIAGPKAQAVKQLLVNEVLNLSLANDSMPPVIATRHDGTVVGTVMPTFLVRLVGCMSQGTSYSATVIAIDGGAVTVAIGPKA